MGDGGRRAGIGPGGEGGGDVVVARARGAEADDVDQQALAGFADGGRQLLRVDGADAIGELFGDGGCGGHVSCSAA